MKKITGFFMAILPFFVLVLLFISGLVIKSNTTVHVSSVHISQDDFARQVPNLDDKEHNKVELDAKVFPTNANNPEVFWISADPNVVEVDKEGEATLVGYGETYVYAQSQDDQTKIDRVKIEVYDDKIHSINVSNTYELSYVNKNQDTKIEVNTVPANHIIDKTLKYESDNESILTVTADGWIMPKAVGEANVTVSANSDPSIQQKVKVNVGEGVERIEFKNPAATVTDSSIYDLREEILTYPEEDPQHTKITSDDFIYETSDEETASVLGSYIVFKKQEPVTVTASYKRNPSLKITKTIRSTCNNILSVNFNANSYEQTIETEQVADKWVYKEANLSNFKVNIFPTSDNLLTNLYLESSDANVAEPYLDLNEQTWKVKIKKPGTATLFATCGEGTKLDPYRFDACLVKVLSPTQGRHEQDLAIIKNSEFTLEKGMFYFPLKNALSLDLNDKQSQNITFDFTEATSIAEIDSNNILHFNEAGTVTIKVYVDGYSTSSTFKVTAKDGYRELTYSTGQTINLVAGQRYKFTNGTPVFEGTTYQKYFNVNSKNEFSAICGQNISEFKIKDQQGNERSIHVIVSEKPLYIEHDVDTYYSTSDSEINFFNLANASIVPSTALKANGDAYKLTYTYTPTSEDVATIENNVITFKQAGLVDVRINCDDISSAIFKIKSTNGGLDKFKVYKGEEEIASNYTQTLAPNNTLELTVSGLSQAELQQINIKSVTDTKLCETNKEITGSFLTGYTATFRIKALSTLYGRETFALETKSYATYINIDVSSMIDDFDVVFNKQVLSGTDVNTTYTNNLSLNVLPSPIAAKDNDYTTELDGTSIPHTNNVINLTLTTGTHNLVFRWTGASGQILKTYSFNYIDNYQGLKISISEADANSNLYLASNDRTATYHLTANGLVPTNFFEQTDKFKASLKATTTAACTIKSNIITVANLPIADGTEFKDELSLSFNDTEIGTYPLTRDIVSKILLPKHDNNDQTDKKGLQKVHVYGNLSYYTKEEGLIDFYKLPIQIYDYKGNEIVNSEKTPSAKTDAMKTLNVAIGQSSTAEYDEALDCIKVKFSAQSLYSELEIANNEFDARNGNKNVTINVNTKSNNAKANYTFVAVRGINTYCEDILKEICNNSFSKKYSDDVMSRTVVLQTNFGLDGKIKDNMPLTFTLGSIPGIYGNGYTIDFEAAQKAKYDNPHYICFAINVTLQGCHDNSYQSSTVDNFVQFKSQKSFGLYEKNYLFKYSTHKNWNKGIYFGLTNNNPAYIKDSMFFRNKMFCLSGNDSDTIFYIENTIFFDCGTLPILLAMNATVNFKGYIGIYNFHGKEMLTNLFGFDVSFLWPLISTTAKANNMLEITADGRECINSFMCTGLDKEIYFWNNKTKQYEKGTKGTPDAANFIGKYIDINIPLTPIEAGLWATYNTTVSPDAFSYYQEFDHEGNIRPEFFKKQVAKVTRNINFF